MINDISVITKRFFRLLERYISPDEALRAQFEEGLRGVYYQEERLLFSMDSQVDSLFFIASGYVTFSVLSSKTDELVTDIFTADQLVISPGFIDGSPANHELRAAMDTYALVISKQAIEQIYKDFPQVAELPGMILNEQKKWDMAKAVMLSKNAIECVCEFYLLFPDLLVPGRAVLRDSQIAAYLLMDERTLARNRQKLLNQGRLRYAKER